MATQTVCIVGGGPAGIGLLWALAQDVNLRDVVAVTVVHDQPELGGHCSTYTVTNPKTGDQVPVDIGVQCISPLVNPNVSAVLQSGSFPESAPVVDASSLTLSCAFPARNGQPMYWGNFPAYQQGPLFQLWSESGIATDCAQFQTIIAVSPMVGYLMQTLQWYLDNHSSSPFPYQNVTDFVTYFVDPIMNIINGYGAPNLDQITFADVLPIFGRIPGFDGPLGSWSVPGVGWQRFEKGASSWVQAMYNAAVELLDNQIVLQTSPATAVWLDPDDQSGQVYVATAQDPNGTAYDKVVLAVDMWTCAELLSCPQNKAYWDNLYSGPLSGQSWSLLQSGTCYIHADDNVLAPDLLPMSMEVAQFNALNATQSQPFDIDYAYTTYLVENVRGGDPAAKGLYVTMYGPDEGTVVPQSPLVKESFTHGMWLPSYMLDSKKAMHNVQGSGWLSGLSNAGTNLYFSGNNLSFDSVEGGFISGMVIANYAFGAPYPVPPSLLTAPALAMFLYIYLDVMFPVTDDAAKQSAIRQIGSRAPLS